jgi:iron complex transport system substrate-binding protein
MNDKRPAARRAARADGAAPIRRLARAGRAARARRVAALAAAVAIALALLSAGTAAADSSRIVVLNGDFTEVVYALGFGKRVVGVDTSATYPGAATRLPKIGYQRALAAEPIIALNPTLVLGSTSAGPPAVIEQLRAAGKDVRIHPAATKLSDVGPKIRRIGKALGGVAVQRAKELAAKVELRIKRAKRTVTAKRKPRVVFLYLRGQQVQQIGGRGSGADAMIGAAGGLDVGREAGIQGFRPLSPEALVELKPTHIVTLSASLQSVGGVNGLLQLPGVAQTPAGRQRNVLAFDDQEFLGLGPRAPHALKALIKGLGTAK